ncbi:MAG: aldo/keto reductase, partial [Clostridiales bacterium]|nr:aldo/keto reductase [Clostridiales bacterium]
FNGMPYRNLGNSGLKCSAVGLGTWKMGYPETGDGSRVDRTTSLDILDNAHDLGVTFWDTANRYNDSSGNSERIIGEWFDMNPTSRRDIVLCTKMCGAMDGKTPNHCGLSRINIIESVYASLERMRTDTIDVLYFHRFDKLTSIEESLMAVEDLIREDIIRYLAVSNFTVSQLENYKAAMESVSKRCAVTAVQNRFDILTLEDNNESVLDYCAKSGISFIAYSPLGRGLLTGRYLDGSAASGDRLYDEGALGSIDRSIFEKAKILKNLAASWDMTLSQLSLAYMLTLPGMGSVIPSSSNLTQLIDNAKAGRIELSKAQKSEIKAITEVQ